MLATKEHELIASTAFKMFLTVGTYFFKPHFAFYLTAYL